jgi:hypothetical protein
VDTTEPAEKLKKVTVAELDWPRMPIVIGCAEAVLGAE